MNSSKGRESNIVTLDVGGTRMKTLRSTLEKLTFFNSYLNRWDDGKNDLFVDYDPNLFIHLLNKLRDYNYVLPENENIERMFDYFGVYMSNIPINKLSDISYPEKPKIPLDLVIIPSKSRDSDRSATDLFSTIGKTIVGVYIFVQPHDLRCVRFSYRETVLFQVTLGDFQVYFKNSGIYELRKKFFNILENRQDIHVEIFYRSGNFEKVLEVLLCGS